MKKHKRGEPPKFESVAEFFAQALAIEIEASECEQSNSPPNAVNCPVTCVALARTSGARVFQ